MELLFVLDLIGTAIFAYGGALAARGHGYHVLGVLYIALLTGVGGGTLRYLLLQTPGLFWLESSAYAWSVLAAIVASYVLKLRANSITFYLLDSYAMAIFIALGFNAAIDQGLALPVAFCIGIIGGIGGNLIRDAITSQPPQALSDPVYPFMMFAGSGGCLIAHVTGVATWSVALVLVLTVAVISIVFRDRLPVVIVEPPLAGPGEVLPLKLMRTTAQEKRHSVSRTFAKAATVLMMTLSIALYFFEPTSNQAVANSTANLASTVEARKLDEYITLARWQLENGNIEGATSTIESASLIHPEHHLLTSIKEERDALKIYLQHIATAEAAFKTEDFDAMGRSLEMAAEYDRHGRKFAYLQGELNVRLSRIDLENKRLALAVGSVDLHLKTAEKHIEDGNYEAAGRELDLAQSYGVREADVTRKKLELQEKIVLAAATLSASDIDYAQAQFGKLQRAIELRNLSALKVLTSENQQKHDLFSKLFERYIEFDVQLTQVSTGKKDVTARLELERMRLPDGNFTYPPSQYGVIALNLKLTENGWTKIQW